MADNVKNTAERAQEGVSPAAVAEGHKAEEHGYKELEQTKERFAASAQERLEGVENSEKVEFVDGQVAEVMSTTKEMKSGAIKSGAATKASMAQIRANLLTKIPTEKEMRSQIEREIKKEIRYLHKKAIHLVNTPGDMSPFEMNNIMRKIRTLKSILYALAKASMDNLKTFWLRFVHGVL